MNKTRIMLVEDETIIAMDLAQRLESFGYEVVATAVSGAQAMQRIGAARPDLLIMDIMIKGPIDGIDTAIQVHHEHRVPVIFLSGNSDESTVARARAAGAYGYLVKPFRPEELRASIEVALVKANMEAQLRQSEQWFAKTLRCISDAVIATDDQGRVRLLNPVAERLTGWTQADARGRSIEEIVQTLDEHSQEPISNPVASALVNRSVAEVGDSTVMVARSGGQVAIEQGAAPIVDDEKTLMGAVMVFRDVTHRRATERALRLSEERFHSAFDHASIGMALVAMDGAILQTNASIAQMLGYSEADLLGMNLRALSYPDDLQDELSAVHSLVANEAPSVHLEKRYLHRSGRPLWMMLSLSLVRAPDESPLYCIVQMQDLTARREAEERLVQMAHQDLLTGLATRAHFIELAGQVVARARRRNEQFGLNFLDLDGFKSINDGHGHDAGDTVLSLTGKRLRECLRDSDIVGRWGGDEFIIIADLAGYREQLALVARKLADAVGQPMLIKGESLCVSASIGIAIYPRDGQTLTALVANADHAMYRAKELGKNQFCFVAENAAPAIMLQSRRESQLRHAVERDELRLHYQPVIYDGKIKSVEALVRWQHPEEGLLAPADFIPIAERSGLILPVGEWVLKTACAQALKWRRQFVPQLRVAVNVSPRQLRMPNFSRIVEDVLAATGLEPQGLELEITESLLMNNVQRSAQILATLADLGVQATMDDFGTGYSSLAYLTRLLLSRLKIDRSFMAGLPGDLEVEAIVRAIVSLAQELGLDVVVEGVETEAQRDYLLGLGDVSLQGFFLHRPMDTERMSALLAEIHRADKSALRPAISA